MKLSEHLRRQQDADLTAYRALLDVDPSGFTAEVEAQAVSMQATMDARATRIREAEEAEAREAASAAAAITAGAPTGDASESRAVAVVTREPRTYTRELDMSGRRSFFVDAFNMSVRGDANARARIERHAREVEVEGEQVTQRDAEARATTTASFAGLVVPQYLVQEAALIARAGRAVANTVRHLPLPDQGTVFFIPKGTTGASVANQATENTSVSNTDEVWANVQINVQTAAGQQDVSRQSLERGTPGIDSLIYADLAGAYAVNLDTQVINGTGTGTKGLLQAGGTQASAFAAAATPATFYTKVAGAVNSVETNRFLPPSVIAMHPRRWNWLVGQTDSSNRPLVVPNAAIGFNPLALADGAPDYGRVVGFLQGLPVVTDASIPTAVGTGPEDQVIVYRAEDAILWEDGDGLPRELRFEQTLGNQLTVKLVVYGYFAFTAERYPLATSIIGGNAALNNGLVAPTF